MLIQRLSCARHHSNVFINLYSVILQILDHITFKINLHGRMVLDAAGTRQECHEGATVGSDKGTSGREASGGRQERRGWENREGKRKKVGGSKSRPTSCVHPAVCKDKQGQVSGRLPRQVCLGAERCLPGAATLLVASTNQPPLGLVSRSFT